MRRRLSVGLLAVLATACLDKLEPLPLQITVEANRATAAPGDTVNFLVTMQGGSLIGVLIDYGDTGAEQYATSGARTARVSFRHVYSARGTFTVRATVTDANPASEQNAVIEIRVQ